MTPFSVIVPAYNAASTLEAQLVALADQDYEGPWEVIVADNGSDDGTYELAERFAADHERFRVVRALDGRSVNFARRAGVAAAGGEFYAFCDADDVVTPGWLAALGRASAEGDLLAGSLDTLALNTPTVRQWYGPWYDWSAGPPAARLGFRPFAIGANFAVRAACYHQVGGFDESLIKGDDVDFSWRVQLAGGRFVYVPDAVVRYRYRTDLRALARQMYTDAIGDVQVYRRFAERGARQRPLRAALVEWLRVLAMAVPAVASGPGGRGEWVRLAAKAAGHSVGSVRERVRY